MLSHIPTDKTIDSDEIFLIFPSCVSIRQFGKNISPAGNEDSAQSPSHNVPAVDSADHSVLVASTTSLVPFVAATIVIRISYGGSECASHQPWNVMAPSLVVNAGAVIFSPVLVRGSAVGTRPSALNSQATRLRALSASRPRVLSKANQSPFSVSVTAWPERSTAVLSISGVQLPTGRSPW